MKPLHGNRQALLRPVHQISVEQDAGGPVYVSLGNDPGFDLQPAGGCDALAPGWYRFSIHVERVDGFFASPCIYPDFGSGMSEDTRIDLPEPDAAGWIDAVIVLPLVPRALRFDPTLHVGRFRLGAPTLRRIPRVVAAARMLHGIARLEPNGRRQASLELRRLTRSLLQGRVSAAAEHLKSRYLASHRRGDRGYAQWLALFEAEAAALRGVQEPAVEVAHAAAQPLVSLVLPVRDTPPHLLQACIGSVVAQTSGDWQLCIADDASTLPDVRRLLEHYAAADPRIRVVYGDRPLHISGNTNRAIDIATGRYVAFLDHDDELAHDAVHEVAAAIERHPEAQLLYSDEDKIDGAGHRHSPHFKPAWNPDLLRSLNYMAHLMVVDARLLRELGGMRTGLEGAQDHDLALRCSEVLGAEQIVHIPRVLYHWRGHEGSTALGASHKPYVLEAGRRAIAGHLARTGVRGEVEILQDGRYRITRDLPAPARVMVVIPTRDRVDLLRTCVDSVMQRTCYPDFGVVVVNNGSVEKATLDYLDELRATTGIDVIDYPLPFNFSDIVNHGVRACDGDVICLLNNDIEVIHADWMREMASQAVRPEIGVVGAMLYYPDDTIQHAGVILGVGGVAGHGHLRLRRGSDGYISRARVVQNLTAVTGACMMFRREVFDAVDGFDGGLAVAFNDVDFCMRVRTAGYLNLWTPFAELYHHESASRGAEDTPAKQARFAGETELMKRRWGDALAADPSYNPNLSLDAESFSLAFPPRRAESRTSRIQRAATAA